MKATARAALLWTKWVGGAAVVLALVALLVFREQSARPAGDGDNTSARWTASGPSASASLARTKHDSSSKVPRFQLQPSANPGERHFQALLIKQRARASGGRVPLTSELFDAETRDCVWAPAMERALDDRLQRTREFLANAAMSGTRIKASECRKSTCRFEFEYTDRDVKNAREAGTLTSDELPYGFVVRETGPFARLSSDLIPEPIEVVDGVTRFRKAVYLIFGQEESDPDSYAAWVAEARRQQAEHQRSSAPVVKTRGLPPAEQR